MMPRSPYARGSGLLNASVYDKMVPKPIHYTDHAVARLARGFTRADIRWLIAQGRRAIWPSKGPTRYWTATGYVGRREARAVFIEDPQRYLIVTVEWVGDTSEGK
jgi:hypothetical protein